MDRLDTWLNAQRGWRRMALLWLQTSPLGIVFAISSWEFFGPQEPISGLLLAAGVALGLIGGIPLGLLYLAVYRWRARKAGPRQPLLTWRVHALCLLVASASLIGIAGLNETHAWHHTHRWLSMLQLAFSVGWAVAALENARYLRRLRTAAEPRNQPC